MKTRILSTRHLEDLAALLEADQVVALPTETVYGLAARAASRSAVERIFAVKGRPADNPLIVHAATPEDALSLGRHVPGYAARLADAFWPGPLSLVLESAVAWPWVQAGHDTLAVRVPEPDWLRELIRRVGPLAAPSANRSGRPSPTTAAHCLTDLSGRIPVVVDGGACPAGLESTVLDCTGAAPVVLRPGPVTAEMIAGVLAESAPGKRGEDGAEGGMPSGTGDAPRISGGPAASPGTRHPHYRPRARVILVAPGTRVQCSDCMIIAPAGGVGPGPATTEMGGAAAGVHLERRWHTLQELARNLYGWFREADRAGVSVIYVNEVARHGLGAALMNRLQKAAAHGDAEG